MEKKDSLDFYETKEYKKYEQKMKEKEKFIKKGSNVIHLEYFGGMISDADISEFENKLENVGIELSRFDKSGVMYASLDKFSLVTYIVIAHPLIVELIKGVGTNATWDVVKYLLRTTLDKVRNKTYTKATSQESTKKDITFGLKVRLDKNTSFDFELNGDLEEKTINKSLDKILSFVEKQQLNKKYKQTDYVFYDEKKNKWIKVDVEKEIRKMIQDGHLSKK